MILVAILGLLLPGYLLARALRSPYSWAIAFPLSAVLLTETVIVFTVLGIPIRFGNVLAAIAVVSLICCGAWMRRKTDVAAHLKPLPGNAVSRVLVVLTILLISLVLLGMLVRTSLYPMSGFDTAFRWEGLARVMLKQENLSYYPPVTTEDFTKYTYPDGFPPLVSTVYWWLYAAWGSAFPAITSVAVLLQAISCFMLVYYAAAILFGRAGGLFAVCVLASAPWFLRGIAIGQETGYTALSYAGQLAFTLLAVRDSKVNYAVIAGLFAALGALAREYGPLLSLCGIAVLACHRTTWRYLPLFCVVAAVFGGIWYLRSWMLIGNPVYPIDIGLGMPANRVLAGMVATYRESMGVNHYSSALWLAIGDWLLLGAPLVLLVGIPCVFTMGKNGIALGIAAAVGFFIWIWSIPYTAGGPNYTLRVLTPVFVALSIAAGALGHWLIQPTLRWKNMILGATTIAVVLCGGFSVLCSWSHPMFINALPGSIVNIRRDPLDTEAESLEMAKQLENSDLPSLGVLTDSSYLALALERHTRFHPVMIWSPEVEYVFDRSLPLAEIRRRLRGDGVRLIEEANFSLNNIFLNQVPFFQQHQNDLKIVAIIPNRGVIFLLSEEESEEPSGKDKPQP